MKKIYIIIFIVVGAFILTKSFFYLQRNNYVYLTVALISGIIWTIFFLLRKDLRRKMLIMSMIIAPLVIADAFFIPEYYNPWLYNVIPLFGKVFLGSLLTIFFWGGIFSVFGQIFTRKTLYKIGNVNPLIILLIPAIFTFYFIVPIKINPIIWFILANFITYFVLFFFIRKEMIKNMFLNAFYLSIFYIPFFYFIWYIFPSVPPSYSSFGLTGITLFGPPIEEFIWTFSAGLLVGPVYEIVFGYFRRKKNQKLA